MNKKDPAVLWYFNDWGGGTVGMTRHQKGAYMDLLHAQFNLGDLSLVQIKNVLGADFGAHWPTIQKKFTFDLVTELYYNERLKQEREKRSNFTGSRRSNRLSKSLVTTTDEHMEDENRNEISINKSLEYLKNIPEADLAEFNRSYEASKAQIKAKAEDLYLWCGANDRKKANYRMFLLTALRKDFKKRPPVEIKAPVVDNRAPLPKEISEGMRALTSKFKA